MRQSRCALFYAVFLTLFAVAAHAGPLAIFDIFKGASNYLGEVDVELYTQDKPITTSNFIYLAESGTYQVGFFHRYEPASAYHVLQGGGFYSYNPYANSWFTPYAGYFGINNDTNTIKNEFSTGKIYSNTNWTIAMAKSSDPNSATCQFYFNLSNNAVALDDTNNAGGFTVFGRVVHGTNILNWFNTQYLTNFWNANQYYVWGGGYSSVFQQLPNVYAPGYSPVPIYSLIYYNVNMLKLSISQSTNGSRVLSWNSVAGVTNNLEFSSNLPPVWSVVTNPVGTGNVITYIEDKNARTKGFYRVHPLF